MGAPSSGLGGCARNHAGALGQPVATLSASGNRLLLDGRDQRLHHLLPRAYLWHRAGGSAALARHSAREQPSPGRVLRAHRLRRGGHVPAYRRSRAAGGLHRAGNLLHLYLRSGRLPQADGPRPRSGHQVFSPWILCHSIPALRQLRKSTRLPASRPPRQITPSSWRLWR